MSFGIYTHVSLKKARDKRNSARTFLADGGDPPGEKKESAKPVRTFAP